MNALRRDYRDEERGFYTRRPDDLHRLSALTDWEVAEGSPDIRGLTVLDRNEEKIGKVDDLLIDTETGQAIFAVVSHGGFLNLSGESTLVPLDLLHLDIHNDALIFDGAAADVTSAPRYREHVAGYGTYYDYWSRLGEREEEEERIPDLRGWRVVDRDNRDLGTIESVITDTGEDEPLAVVSYGKVLGMGGGDTLVPLDQLEIDSRDEVAVFSGTQDDIENAPVYYEDTRDYRPFYDFWERTSPRHRRTTTSHEAETGVPTSRGEEVHRGRKEVEVPVDHGPVESEYEEEEEEERTRR